MSDVSPLLAEILTDRFRIVRQIGQGGMATVYLAEDLKHGRQVAIKSLRPEFGAALSTERFLAEVRISARLDHPNILTLIDSGAANGILYYVLPFVRGESLRDLLDREPQLSIERTLSIATQIASALDYAHRQGVLHRDVKPENVLLHEGVAMLADFGIALAMQESGGDRLTETGLSLGTPSYMSPEQATGERMVDARSDQYALAAVVYEMLVGEPPVTGRTAQAVIAKLLTEPPMHVRTVRSTVPEHMDAAIDKALSKLAADRFSSVDAFCRALSSASTTAERATRSTGYAKRITLRGRRRLVGATVAGALILGAAAMFLARGRATSEGASARLRDRTQLTFTGNVRLPALSLDGKQLAYFAKECTEADCHYAVDLQDVGSTTTRRVLGGATDAYGLDWSPDRRNLIVQATIDGRTGFFVLSALGGTPRFLTSGFATFFAGGDSLLLGPPGASDTTMMVRVAGLDGSVRDSIQLPRRAGSSLAQLITVPGTSRFVAVVSKSFDALYEIVDRHGKLIDSMPSACACGAAVSRDAIWMANSGLTGIESIVRVALDAASGKLSAYHDTIYSGRFTNFSVTEDGTRMAVDNGSDSFIAVAGRLSDVMAGRTRSGARLLRASNQIEAFVSPDGARILIRRNVPKPDGTDGWQFAVSPFGGGAEIPLSLAGQAIDAQWFDSVTIGVRSRGLEGETFARVDVRTGAENQVLRLGDSLITAASGLPDGWAWISAGDRIVVEQHGKRHTISKPLRVDRMERVAASPDGSQLLIMGALGSASDSIAIAIVPTAGGGPVEWARAFGSKATAAWLTDSTIAFTVWTGSKAQVRELSGPGRERSLGTVAQVSSLMSVSRDLKRATLMWRDYRGDAWMYRVEKR